MAHMQTFPIQKNQLEFNKKTVHKLVKICVNCGNTAVHIQNYNISCKNCNSFFNVEKKDNSHCVFKNKIENKR